MKFLRSRIAVLSVVVMSIFSLISVTAAVRVTVTTLERKNQIIDAIPMPDTIEDQTVSKVFDTGKVSPMQLYFNGKLIDGLNAFYSSRQVLYLPIDEVFKKLDLDFKYFAPDDIFEADIGGKKICIKLGKDTFSYAGTQIKLSAVPFAAEDHILVPESIFEFIDGFNINYCANKNSVFMNCYMNFENELKGVNVITVHKNDGGQGDFISICEAAGKKETRLAVNDDYSSSWISASEDNMNYFLNLNNKSYILNDKGMKICSSDVAPYASWSSDNRYLYWNSYNDNKQYVYNVKADAVKELGNYSFIPLKNGQAVYMNGYDVLHDYTEISAFKRVVLTNRECDDFYGFIERHGKTVIEGKIFYSPNSTKIIFYKDGKGFFSANADGTGIAFLGDGEEAGWINNNKIFLRTKAGTFLFDKHGKNRKRAEGEWRMVGQTPKGEVFYTRDKTLFCEVDSIEKKVMDLPWVCDYIYSFSAEGPYIAVSGGQQDGVYYLNNHEIVKIGSHGQLLKKNKDGANYIDYKASIPVNAGNMNMAVLQKEQGFVSIKLVDTQGEMRDKVILDLSSPDNKNYTDSIKCRWISDNRLLIHTLYKGHIIDFNNGVKIYEWQEQEGSTIEGVLP